MDSKPKVAFVQDALPFQGGAERVLEAAVEVFPDAPIFTLVYRKDAFHGTRIAEQAIYTSFIDRLPGARRHHRAYLPLMPFAVEQFDFRGYDIVISFSYAVAHGILPRPDQLHICYMHTPMRYSWQMYHSTLADMGSQSRLTRWMAQLFLHSFRQWDFSAAARVDQFITVSSWMAGCIRRAYHRSAQVLYPPVNLERFKPLSPRDDYYITVSRLVAHKKVDLIIRAFNQLGLPLVVVGEGPEFGRLKRMAGPNVELTGRQSDLQLASLLGRAKGFIQANEEDFGIAMAEAQASGCPVIALNAGGAKDIIQPDLTGQFFSDQTPESLAAAVGQFDRKANRYDPNEIVKNAARFDHSIFLEGFAFLVNEYWRMFQERDHAWESADRILLPVPGMGSNVGFERNLTDDFHHWVP
jgi:glycosyltransferase involved in cell wall biosynthesis